MADIYALPKKRAEGSPNNGQQSLEEFIASQRWREGPGTVIFYSQSIHRQDAEFPASVTARVDVPNGNAYEVIEFVAQNGGIWSNDGTYFIPWPFAFIEMQIDEPKEIAT